MYLPTYPPTYLFGHPVNLAHLGLDIPSRGLIGGGTCNTGTSAFFPSSLLLLFLLLASTTAATTVTATSTHTSSIPPTPADIAVISVLGPSVSRVPITSTVELGVPTAVGEWVWSVDVEVGLVAVDGDLTVTNCQIFEEKREENH